MGLSGDNARKEGPGQRSILISLPLPLHASTQGPEGQGPALDRQSIKKSGRNQRANRTKAGLRCRPEVLGSPTPLPLAFLWFLNFHAVTSDRCPTVNPTSPCCLCGQFSKHGPWLASASWGHWLEKQLLGWSPATCVFSPSGDCLRSSVRDEAAGWKPKVLVVRGSPQSGAWWPTEWLQSHTPPRSILPFE